MSHIPRASSLATQGYNKPSARLGLRRPLVDSANAVSDKDVLKAEPTKPSYGFRTRTGITSTAGGLKPSANAGALKPSALGAKHALRKATATKPTLKEEIVNKEAEIDSLTKKLNDVSVEDIDAEDRGDPLLCSEYISDIYTYMRHMEQELAVKPTYLATCTDITERMRGILVDWLIQVHMKFKLLQETLYLTIRILDRYLSMADIQRGQLQLCGVTAMLIASKFEEIYAPEVNDFVYITDKAYTERDILDMEIKMLNTLAFDINHPICLHFLRRNSKAGGVDGKFHTLGKYLMELCLPSTGMLKFKPSEIAAGAFLISLHVLSPEKTWNSTLTHYTGYTKAKALVPAKAIAELVIRSDKSKLQAVKNKYNSPKFFSISSLAALSKVEDFISTEGL